MSFRATFISLLILAALGAVVWFEYRADMAGELSQDQERRVLHLPQGEAPGLQGIDLIRPGGSVSLRKGEEGWTLVSPVATRADDGKVQGLLATLAALEIQDRIDPPRGGLAPFGLDPPLLEVRLLHDGVQGVEEVEGLEVGAVTPVGRARYARRTGEPAILTVSSSLGGLLDLDPEALRDTRVAPVEPEELSGIDMSWGGRRVTLARDAGGSWRWGSTAGREIEGRRVNELLSALEQLRAGELLTAGEGDTEGGVLLEMSLSSRDGDPVEFRLFEGTQGDHIALSSVSAYRYRIAGGAVEELLARAGAVRPSAGAKTAGQEAGAEGDS